MYGHTKRLEWILSHIHKSDKILEFGCGTGYMISLPLVSLGYNAYGVDMDQKSIDLGKKIFHEEGLDTNRLQCADLAALDLKPDVIIASEILEHITDHDLPDIMHLLRSQLKPGGRLLVTVPNGYGWFELESFLWFKARLGRIIELPYVGWSMQKLKSRLFGTIMEEKYPSTLSPSSHVQRFTLRSITNLLIHHNFNIIETKGSVLFSGPFSNILFSGIKPVMKLNSMLGNLFPRQASSFYIFAVKK